jgi:hypothetical protein
MRPTTLLALLLTIGLPTARLSSACGDDGDGGSSLCSSLPSRSGCDSSATKTCNGAIDSEKSSHPSCTSQLDELTSCIAALDVSCTGTTSIAASGDGQFQGQNFISIGGASVVINDSKCDALKRTYESCRGGSSD